MQQNKNKTKNPACPIYPVGPADRTAVESLSVFYSIGVKSVFAITCPMKPFFLLFHRGLTGVPKTEVIYFFTSVIYYLKVRSVPVKKKNE